MPRVKYLRNADPREGTAAIKHNNDDRDDLVIGQEGLITPREYAILSQSVVFEVIDSDEHPDLVDDVDQPVDDLEEKNVNDLRDVADQEDVDISGLQKKDEIRDAIRDARNPQPEGPASLPATASAPAVPPTPVVAGAGGAAGPEGAEGGPVLPEPVPGEVTPGGNPDTTTGGRP